MWSRNQKPCKLSKRIFFKILIFGCGWIVNLFVPDKGSDDFPLYNHYDSCVSCGEYSVYICDPEKCWTLQIVYAT